MMRLVGQAVLTTLLICGAGLGQPAKPAPPDQVPVLVELFTSEGCSSCPPADRFLESLDAQPIPGTEIVVLSEHVDYWDHEGWKDPFSSHELTERQALYGRQFHLPDVYTPQIVVDGSRQLSGGDARGAGIAIREARSNPKTNLRISGTVFDQSRVRVRLEGAAAPQPNGPRSADIYVAVALNRAESQVARGENANRRLSHVAVVRKMTRVGKVKGGEPFSRDVELKVEGNPDAGNLRVVAFLQDPDSGRVVGVTMSPVHLPKSAGR